MATTRKNSYATAYMFGTDGSAALAGDPIATPQRNPVAHGKASRRRMYAPMSARVVWRMPLWTVILGVAMMIFIVSFLLLGVRSDMTEAAKKKADLQVELARAKEVIASLEVNIDQRNDPQRIHSIAVNRLGMRMPAEGQVQVLQRPQPLPRDGNTAAAQREEGGFFRLLLSLVGL